MSNSTGNQSTRHSSQATHSSAHHATHAGHTHTHGSNCGHQPIRHLDHTDYLHDGHLHCPHESHFDEHQIEVSQTNPESCTPQHACSGHEKAHRHGAGCGHQSLPHGEHTDYLVDNHLHHSHGDHCDDHGMVAFS